MGASVDLTRLPEVEKNEDTTSSEFGTSSSHSSSTNLVKRARDAHNAKANVVRYSVGLGSFFSTVGLMSVVLIIALDNYIIGMKVILSVTYLLLRAIVNALPKLVTSFNDLGVVGWYGSSYFLTLTSFQPLFGQLCTLYPIKTVYLLSILSSFPKRYHWRRGTFIYQQLRVCMESFPHQDRCLGEFSPTRPS